MSKKRRVIIFFLGLIYPVSLAMGYMDFVERIRLPMCILLTLVPITLTLFELMYTKNKNNIMIKELFKLKIFYFTIYLFLLILDNIFNITLTYYIYGLSILVATDRIGSNLIKYNNL